MYLHNHIRNVKVYGHAGRSFFKLLSCVRTIATMRKYRVGLGRIVGSFSDRGQVIHRRIVVMI